MIGESVRCFTACRFSSNLHKRDLRISRNITVVLLGDFGLRLAEILPRSVKGSVRHFGGIGMVERERSDCSKNSSNVIDRVLKVRVCVFELFLCQGGGR